MGNQPNLNLLNEMGRDIFGYNMKEIELRKVKEGDFFKRKPSAYTEYVRNHSMWRPTDALFQSCYLLCPPWIFSR